MDEQNNQFSENQEPKEEIKETKSNDKKPIPKISIIIGAIAVAVIAIAVVLIILLGGKHEHEWGEWETVTKATSTEKQKCC